MKKHIKTLFIIIGLFIAIILIINTSPFDEKLNPKIISIMQDRPLPEVDNNAYFAIMGINSAADKNIIETGSALINRYQQNRSQGNDDLSQEEFNEILGTKNGTDKQWLEHYSDCDASREDDCLIKLSQLLLDPSGNNLRLSLMLDRYEDILNLPFYASFNDITFGTPFPHYLLLLRLGNIKKAQLYNNDDKTNFLLHINREIKFWKMVLRDGEMILDKMVAQGNIRNNLYYLSTYLRYNQPTQEQSILVQSILTPLNNQELDISNSFISESRSIIKAVNALSFFDFEYPSFLLQENAHHNLLYKYFTKPFGDLSKMSSKKVYQTIKSSYFVKLKQEREALISYSPTSLYNFHGKISVNGYCESCWDYAVRVHDLNNIINLVNIQLQLKTSQTINTQEFISKSPIKNNYTEESFVYDKKENTVKFECLDVNYKGCNIKL